LTLRRRDGKLFFAEAEMGDAPKAEGDTGARGQSAIDRIFRLAERNATLRGEILGGLTTFMTMAYIIFVNAAILADPNGAAGMPSGGVMVATCLGAAIATALMGCLANLPVALAPGMGMNALIAYSICAHPDVGWPQALGMVFWAGAIFLALSAFRFREKIINAIPPNLKHGAAAGIGLFIAFIGLQKARIVVASPATLVDFGGLATPATLVAVFGLALISVLMALGVRGAVLIGIVATGVVAVATGVVQPPSDGYYTPYGKVFGEFGETFLALDLRGALAPAAWGSILTLLFFDMFDTVGTLMGVTEEAGLVDEDGRIPNAGRALASDAAGSVAGALLGTSTVTSYIESAAGVAAGARTGLSNLVVAALFLLSLVALPLFWVFGTLPAVTAPALIVVGFLMTGPLKRINWDDASEGLPAFLTVILMPLTFSISTGLAAGFVSYSFLKTVRGEGRKVHPLVHAIALAIVVGYALLKVIAHLKAAA
jgi:AGZA family xanthine/uracil permease-like MFS transporter